MAEYKGQALTKVNNKIAARFYATRLRRLD